MAETAVVAFGRYLRTLRQRRGLSLDDVHGLSRAFPDQIGKHYLSRAENGHLRIAFSKLIALSRIYDVPADVFVERMELDLELERIGGPETASLGFRELTELGKQSAVGGNYWHAYAFFRDALAIAPNLPLDPAHRDLDEQYLCALMNCAIPSLRLGRHRLALAELSHARARDGIQEYRKPALMELLSQCYRGLGELPKANELMTKALSTATRVGDRLSLAYAYADQAALCNDQENYKEAAKYYQRAHPLFQSECKHHETAKVLIGLAVIYVTLERLGAAKRSLAAAERIATSHDLSRQKINVRIVSGRIAKLEGQHSKATSLWREAIDLAKRLNEHLLLFEAELCLFEHAIEVGDETAARSFERLLRRRASWIPPHVEGFRRFQRIVMQRSVAHSQLQ